MKIAMVSHSVYPLLSRLSVNKVGGAQVQMMYMGNILSQMGHDISYITGVFENSRNDEVIEEFKIYKTYNENDGIKGIHFFYPRIWKLWQALKRADADVYLQRGSSYTSGIIARFCAKYNRKFILSAAHDRDFLLSNSVASLRSLPLYVYGLRRADVIMVQSQQQKELLTKNFSREGVVVKNVFPPAQLVKAPEYVLWTGRITAWKRPELFLSIAKRNPHYRFVMIGGSEYKEGDLYKKIKTEAENIQNLIFKGFLPFFEAERYFDGASVFINTSTCEGFPNTFLQSWSRGIPVISFFDPDNTISDNGLGVSVSSLDDIDLALPELMEITRERRREIQSYFIAHHSFQNFMDVFPNQVLSRLDVG